MSQFWCFTFGNDQPLARKYVTVEAPSADRAADLMIAVYGNAWGFQYERKDFMPIARKHGYKSVPFGTPNVEAMISF